MHRCSLLITLIFIPAILMVGCSGGGDGSSVTPELNQNQPPGLIQDITTQTNANGQVNSQTHLWGYYDVSIDIESRTVEFVLNRSVMFAANVVNFLNGNPAGLQFSINSTPSGPGYIDVDIDVGLTHPFPGLHQYDGYDVRGIFIGDGSDTLAYNSSLRYAVYGVEQALLNADGYTRWFNPSEFTVPGLFGYTPGNLATPGYHSNATLNPYMYFADGLTVTENLWDFLTTTDNHGVFASGSTNRRNYYLRFPDTKGITYSYAVLANWEAEDVHPSNAPEAVGCSIDDYSSVYYIDPSTNGGNLDLDINLFAWGEQPSMIVLESTVLTTPHEFTPTEMIGVGGGENYCTYHVEIPADNVNGLDGNEYWLIAEIDGEDYSNETGIHNQAEDETLAAFFRYGLFVSDEVPAWIEVTSPNGGEEWDYGSSEEITWDSGNVTGTVFIEYSRDNFDSDINLIASDEANDGGWMWDPIQCPPSDSVRIRVSSTDNPEVNDVSDAEFIVIGTGWARTWGGDGGTGNDIGHGVTFDNQGNIYVTGGFLAMVDFDPDGGDEHSSNGSYDAFLSKFDSTGIFDWVRTWGAYSTDYALAVASDSQGLTAVTGHFAWEVDFAPSSPPCNNDPDIHSSNGFGDVFLTIHLPDGCW